MFRIVLAGAVICGVGIAAGGAASAQAAVIDTFDFTQAGWVFDAGIHDGVLVPDVPDPGGILTGSFSGTVEPSGLIELGDLTAFSVAYSDTGFPAGHVSLALGDLKLFSYNTLGGPSSLDIDAGSGNRTCVGAAVPFSSDCTFGFAFAYPPGINGAVFEVPSFFTIPNFITAQQPAITLVSSVTTTPHIPEPSSISLFASFIAGMLGLAGWATRRRPAADMAEMP